jgi:hypothetical protein
VDGERSAICRCDRSQQECVPKKTLPSVRKMLFSKQSKTIHCPWSPLPTKSIQSVRERLGGFFQLSSILSLSLHHNHRKRGRPKPLDVVVVASHRLSLPYKCEHTVLLWTSKIELYYCWVYRRNCCACVGFPSASSVPTIALLLGGNRVSITVQRLSLSSLLFPL